MTTAVEQIFIYPVKSLGGFVLNSVELSETGFAHDRRFMLVDEDGRFLTQRGLSELALFKTEIVGDVLTIHAPHVKDNPSISVPLNSAGQNERQVVIWSDTCAGHIVSAVSGEFFSDILKMKCDLIYMPHTTRRLVDHRYSSGKEITAFTDGYPILLIGTASLDDLNERLIKKGEVPVGFDRFRANLVVKTSVPFEEDNWKEFKIGDLKFSGVKLCSRCVMTTIDQKTGRASKEPLRTLAEYRAKDHKVNFGQNVIAHQSIGMIRTGDFVNVGF